MTTRSRAPSAGAVTAEESARPSLRAHVSPDRKATPGALALAATSSRVSSAGKTVGAHAARPELDRLRDDARTSLLRLSLARGTRHDSSVSGTSAPPLSVHDLLSGLP